MEPDKKLLGEDRRALLLEWGHHIEGLERMDGFCALEMDQAKEALLYLRGVLGDDFLWRCSAGDPYVARHPILMLLANFAPCSRRRMTRFAGYLRVLEGSQNLDKVLARLHDMSQFNHDGLLIKAAAKLVEQGLRARFEPTMHVEDNQRQPDLRLEEPVTGETLFLEVVTQAPAQREREVTDTNSAVIGAVFGISYELCFSARWHQTPSKQVLGGILERIRVGAVRALNERTLVAVQEEDILDMALCHRDDKASLLDPWSEEGAVGRLCGAGDESATILPGSRGKSERSRRNCRATTRTSSLSWPGRLHPGGGREKGHKRGGRRSVQIRPRSPCHCPWRVHRQSGNPVHRPRAGTSIYAQNCRWQGRKRSALNQPAFADEAFARSAREIPVSVLVGAPRIRCKVARSKSSKAVWFVIAPPACKDFTRAPGLLVRPLTTFCSRAKCRCPATILG